MEITTIEKTINEALNKLGVQNVNQGTSTGSNFFGNGEIIESFSPVDGKLIGKVTTTSKEDYEKVMTTASKAFKSFRNMPAPQRGEIVRQFGNKLRDLKEPLGKLVSYEMGKSLQEGYGEVQEMIDICDFAVGLSRQLNGQTIPSERPRSCNGRCNDGVQCLTKPDSRGASGFWPETNLPIEREG